MLARLIRPAAASSRAQTRRAAQYGAWLRPSHPRAYSGGGFGGSGDGSFFGRVRNGLRNPVYWLIAANVGAFVVYQTAAQTDPALRRWFHRHMVVSQSRIREGHYESILGSAFFHQRPIHLLFNMIALHGFGQTAQMMLGTRTFLGLYFASAVTGSLAHLYSPTLVRQLDWPARRNVFWDVGAVGASGAIAGLTMYVCCRIPQGEVMLFFLPVKNWIFVPLFLLGSSYMAYTGDDTRLAHAGHLGGAVAGILLFLARRGRY